MNERQIINKIKDLEFWLKSNPPSHPNYALVSKDKQDYERKLKEKDYDRGGN